MVKKKNYWIKDNSPVNKIFPLPQWCLNQCSQKSQPKHQAGACATATDKSKPFRRNHLISEHSNQKALWRQHQFSAGHSGCLLQQDDLRMRASCDQHCPWTQRDCRLPDQSPFSRLSVWDRVSLYSRGGPQTCGPLRWPCPSCLSAMVKWRLQRDLSHGTLDVFICWQWRAAKPSK